jgi:hypothetical protein
MRRAAPFCTLAVLMTAVAGRVQAQPSRLPEIVYAARVYFKPGDRRVSRFHLYAVRPDGSGRVQLTNSAKADDRNPHWSPDGRWIAFEREDEHGARLMVYSTASGKLRTLHTVPEDPAPGMENVEQTYRFGWTPDSRVWVERVRTRETPPLNETVTWSVDPSTGAATTLAKGRVTWSPDGTRRLVQLQNETWLAGPGRTKRTVKMPCAEPVWVTSETLLGLSGEPDRQELLALTPEGSVTARAAVTKLAAKDDEDFMWNPGPTVSGGTALFRTNRGHALEGARRVWGWYRVGTDLKAKFLMEAMSISFAPDAARYAAVPTTTTLKLGSKEVYGAPLRVFTTTGSQPRTIVGGTVWVWSADWRQRR